MAKQNDQAHHPDIRAALEAILHSAPEARERVSAALRVLLRGAYAANTPEAWKFSRLTGDGFPLEFTFSTADTHLRYAADPGALALPVTERLAEAIERMDELGQAPCAFQVLDYLKTWQQEATDNLSYGAWVGGRHPVKQADGNGILEDRFKLYAEIPATPWESHLTFIRKYLDLPPRLLERPVQLRMVAMEPSTGRIEFYFRIHHLETGVLPLLLRPAGLQQRSVELADFIEQAYGHPLSERIPGGSVGFSYSLIPGSKTIVFTLFLFTRLLWGGDARIRSRFAERLRTAGQDPSAYWRFSAPLAERDVYQTYHGLIGLAMAPQAPIQLTLGVRPPPLPDRRAIS